MGTLILLIGLALIAFLALAGVPVVVASLLSGTVVLLLSSLDLYEGLAVTFMGGFSGFVTKFFLVFLFGAIFGKIVEISGATETIARVVVNKFGEKYIMVGIIIAAAIMVYGGVSLYVCLFAIYPIAMSLFKKANLPRRLFPAAYVAGTCTFSMTSPFTPSVQNIIPTKYLGTDVTALAGPGIIVTIFTAVMVIWWMQRMGAKAKARGEGFVPLASDVEVSEDSKRPNMIISLIPLVVLIVSLNVLKFSIEGALFTGIIAALACYFPYIPKNLTVLWKHVTVAISDGVTAIVNTSSTVGFGTIIAATPAFAAFIPVVTSIDVNPLISASIGVTVLCGLCGSASGGLGISLPILSEVFLPMGVNPEALHRVSAVAASGLDSLPHNGGIVTFLNYSKVSHKEGYKDIFVVSVIVTIISLVLLFGIMAIFGYM